MTGLRYVVLRHEGVEVPHFDLMFETCEPPFPLRTFRSLHWPITSRIEVERLADHRRAYLDYEGPLSGGRGRVTRVEAGVYDSQAGSDGGLYWMHGPTHRRTLSLKRAGMVWVAEPVSSA